MTPMRSLAAFSASVLLTCGAGWACFHTAMGAVVTSHLRLDPADAPQQDQNLLLLGLDSRLDEEGHPLPQEMYDALHAGDDSAGGYNANVLIVVHIPKSGAITAVSVPRDDYVDIPACPEGQCQAKVKQAYGLAYAQALDNIPATADVDTATREQSARDAGRRAEVDTVQNLLGVHLDHFVEVTLAGFFQVAALTQPITVCLNADTSDDYSGANFRQGVQDLSAAQAVAFVRQRRDDNDGSFTDLDRTRRQQAFLVSLLGAVRRGHGMTDPVNLARLLDIAHRDMAVDAGFDLGEFVTQAAHLVDRPISLYTLPITDFGQDAQGSDINLVDVAALRRLVADRFGTADTSDTADTADGAAPVAGPDVVAATGPGPSAPAPTQLSRMDATSAAACVK